MSNTTKKGLKLELLLSTMNRTSLDFLVDMFPKGSYLNHNILIVNQTSQTKLLESEHSNIRVINSFESGLTKSRNLALKSTIGDICLIADDDVKYMSDFEEVVQNAFCFYDDADIVTFKMKDFEDQYFKPYHDEIRHNKDTVKTVNSVVIAFKPESIKGSSIAFNTHFGLGSTFETADEYIFLRDALKANLKLYFMPKTILNHHFNSSGRDSGSNRLVFARSALFYKYSGILGYLRLCKYLYLINKDGYIKKSEFFKKFKVGLKGISAFKRLSKSGQ